MIVYYSRLGQGTEKCIVGGRRGEARGGRVDEEGGGDPVDTREGGRAYCKYVGLVRGCKRTGAPFLTLARVQARGPEGQRRLLSRASVSSEAA